MQLTLRSRHYLWIPVPLIELWVLALIFAAPAFGQDQFDCASFGSQEAAQAELERDPSDPSNLDADNDGIACEELAGGTEGGAQGTDLDCADFATQAEAQAEFDADTSDPNGLDADNDGIACEELGGSGTSSQSGESTAASQDASGANRQSADAFRCESFLKVVRDDRGNVRHQYQGDELFVRRFEQCLSEDVLKGTIANRKLPDTGGLPVLLVVGPLLFALVGAGLIVARKR
jgi:hypothetical protein